MPILQVFVINRQLPCQVVNSREQTLPCCFENSLGCKSGRCIGVDDPSLVVFLNQDRAKKNAHARTSREIETMLLHQ